MSAAAVATPPQHSPELASDPVENFRLRGYHPFARPVDVAASAKLLARARATRAFDESLFLSEAEFDANPTYKGVNPIPGRNLLDQFSDDLGFVEQDPMLVEGLSALLGPDFEILNRKFVCGMPQDLIPAWVRQRLLGNPVNNLGAYIRPEYRDITYFYGIDFHQDVIDFPERPADMITLYVYLHDVTMHDAPLYLLENSHLLGATVFPHTVVRSVEGSWTYSAPGRGEVSCRQIILTGGAGYTAMWGGCTLHGTQPDRGDRERLSLRYLIVPKPGTSCPLDALNAELGYPVILRQTRADLDAAGKAVIKSNSVNQA